MTSTRGQKAGTVRLSWEGLLAITLDNGWTLGAALRRRKATCLPGWHHAGKRVSWEEAVAVAFLEVCLVGAPGRERALHDLETKAADRWRRILELVGEVGNLYKANGYPPHFGRETWEEARRMVQWHEGGTRRAGERVRLSGGREEGVTAAEASAFVEEVARLVARRPLSIAEVKRIRAEVSCPPPRAKAVRRALDQATKESRTGDTPLARALWTLRASGL